MHEDWGVGTVFTVGRDSVGDFVRPSDGEFSVVWFEIWHIVNFIVHFVVFLVITEIYRFSHKFGFIPSVRHENSDRILLIYRIQIGLSRIKVDIFGENCRFSRCFLREKRNFLGKSCFFEGIFAFLLLLVDI